MLIGKYGGKKIASAIQDTLTKDMLSHEHVTEFQSATYSRQNNDSSTNYVKRVLNYFIDYRYRGTVIDQLMADFYPDERNLIHDYYMTKAELKHMHKSGMVLGSHTVSHPVMSKLSVERQEKEIVRSYEMLNSIIGKTEVVGFQWTLS